MFKEGLSILCSSKFFIIENIILIWVFIFLSVVFCNGFFLFINNLCIELWVWLFDLCSKLVIFLLCVVFVSIFKLSVFWFKLVWCLIFLLSLFSNMVIWLFGLFVNFLKIENIFFILCLIIDFIIVFLLVK